MGQIRVHQSGFPANNQNQPSAPRHSENASKRPEGLNVPGTRRRPRREPARQRRRSRISEPGGRRGRCHRRTEISAPEGAEPRESGETDKAKALYCVKTGEGIPNDAYSRRAHFITCCWGDCNPGDDVDGSKDQEQPPTDRKTEGKLGANMEITFILNLKPEKDYTYTLFENLGLIWLQESYT